MLYESTYNQYFLEHSWGPWRKHMYISRDGESGNYTYKYPKEYYDKYKTYTKERASNASRSSLDMSKAQYDSSRTADQNKEYYDDYYNDIDKIINRSVKAAVSALNFGHNLRTKAEGYLNRFGNAVANAWNSAKSPVRTRIQAGKQFVSNMWNYTKNRVTAKRIAASVQNLIKGAGEAISKGWNEAKNSKAGRAIKNTVEDTKRKVRNTVRGVKARAQGAEPV